MTNLTTITNEQLDNLLALEIDACNIAGSDSDDLLALFAERKRRNEARAAELAEYDVLDEIDATAKVRFTDTQICNIEEAYHGGATPLGQTNFDGRWKLTYHLTEEQLTDIFNEVGEHHYQGAYLDARLSDMWGPTDQQIEFTERSIQRSVDAILEKCQRGIADILG